MQADIKEEKERREFKRLPVLVKVAFSILDSNQCYEGITQNISPTGLLFQTKQPLQANSVLQISIQDRRKIFPPLQATATVLRVEKGLDKAYYQVATRLVNVQ